MVQIDPLPHGPLMALEGLRGAIQRVHSANSRLLSGGAGGVWIALTEALNWVAALDDSLHGDTYFVRRARDHGGRCVGGLVFARNRHAHELVSAGGAEFIPGSVSVVVTPPNEPPPPRGRGTLFSVQLRWVELADLLPSDAPERHGRDEMYASAVGGQPLTAPLSDAADWIESLVVAEA